MEACVVIGKTRRAQVLKEVVNEEMEGASLKLLTGLHVFIGNGRAGQNEASVGVHEASGHPHCWVVQLVLVPHIMKVIDLEVHRFKLINIHIKIYVDCNSSLTTDEC